jgi:UDP-glucose 4-epimerase
MKTYFRAEVPAMSGLRVLITGGLGFIGSNLAHRCLDLGAKVTIYDCLDPKSGGNMRNLHGIEDLLEIVLNDIRNFEGVCSCIRNKDIIFHCAAFTSHPNSMREPLIDIDVNCKGTVHILEAARRFNPRVKIVHVGTSTQIGRMRTCPIDEYHVEYPVDIYSANKTSSEKYVLIYASAYKMRTTVIRLANNFGARSNIRTPDFGFMNYFIGLALRGRTMSVFGEGQQTRNVSYVEDSITALLLAALSDEANGEAFFAVGDGQYTVAQIAEAIARNIGGQVNYIPWPKDRAAIEIGDAIISNAKIKAALKWKPSFTLDEGLRKTKDYFLQQLEHYLE